MKPVPAARLSVGFAMGVLLWSAGALPAHAMLLQESADGQECRGHVPACLSVDSNLIVARPNDQQTTRLRCPPSAPFFWNWSADVGSHVQVQLIAPVLNDERDEIGGRFFILNQASATPGALRIHLGCSPLPPSADHPITFRYEGFGWHPHERDN